MLYNWIFVDVVRAFDIVENCRCRWQELRLANGTSISLSIEHDMLNDEFAYLLVDANILA